MKKRFKSISLVVAMLVLSLLLGSVAPLAAPAEASALPTLDGREVETRRIGAVRGRGGVDLARASSLAAALRQPTVDAVVYLTPGSLLVQHGSRELLVLAGSRTAFLTTGIGTRTPSISNVTLTALPQTVAARDLFVPFADVVRHLGGSITGRVADMRDDAPDPPFVFAGAERRNVVGGLIDADLADDVTNVRMIGRGATFPNSLYRGGSGHGVAPAVNSWLNAFRAASEDVSTTSISTPNQLFGYNQANIGGTDITDAIPAGGAVSGSGMGVDAIRLRAADFAGTDLISLIPAGVREAFPLIPTAKGGVAVIFNLTGTNNVRINHLNLTADTIAGIYLGRISHWNDPEIRRLNPAVAAVLPENPIQVHWRTDASGTTEIFTAYLNAASRAWQTALTPTQRTTVDLDAVVTTGVANWDAAELATTSNRRQPETALTSGSTLRNHVNARANSIGYVSYGDAVAYLATSGAVGDNLGVARVRNRAGIFVLPEMANVYAAGIGHGNVHAHPVNSANAGAYPITGLTWIMVEKDPGAEKPAGVSVQPGVTAPITLQPALTDAALTAHLQRNAVVVDFLRWAVVEGFGDAEARTRNMAPLTPAMKREAARLLGTIEVSR